MLRAAYMPVNMSRKAFMSLHMSRTSVMEADMSWTAFLTVHLSKTAVMYVDMPWTAVMCVHGWRHVCTHVQLSDMDACTGQQTCLKDRGDMIRSAHATDLVKQDKVKYVFV